MLVVDIMEVKVCNINCTYDYNVDVFTISAVDRFGKTISAGSLFDLANVVLYSIEGDIGEAVKSLVFMLPGLDMLEANAKYVAKGRKYVKQQSF